MADVAIIGAGPAGIFAALELVRQKPGLDIVIIEKGKDIYERSRSANEMLIGWGGAGAYSDGKLTISSEVGGQLASVISEERLMDLLDTVDDMYREYAAPDQIFSVEGDDAAWISAKARLAGMIYLPTKVRHIGTENCYTVLKNMRDDLDGKITIKCEVEAKTILHNGQRVEGVVLDDGAIIDAGYVIVAPGRAGSAWMANEAKKIGLDAWPNPVDLGVRVELPAVTFEKLTNIAYETKFIYYSKTFDDKVRTFCMNPYGEVVQESVDDLLTVNGHSWKNKHTENTNFAILVSANFTQPFDDPIGYGKSVASMANMLGKGVIIQRLGDLLKGRRTTDSRLQRCSTRPTLKTAIPGDLSYCIPYRILTDIVEMLECLDHIAPGVNSDHTLLYGIEVKFYSHRIQLDSELCTQMSGLYVIGDGAGITRGLMQASCSGILAAQSIISQCS